MRLWTFKGVLELLKTMETLKFNWMYFCIMVTCLWEQGWKDMAYQRCVWESNWWGVELWWVSVNSLLDSIWNVKYQPLRTSLSDYLVIEHAGGDHAYEDNEVYLVYKWMNHSFAWDPCQTIKNKTSWTNTFVSLPPICGCHATSYFKFLCLNFPTMIDCTFLLWRNISPL